MARKGENIYKRRDGRWEGRYILGRKSSGQARYGSVYGRTYAEVKERLTLCKAEHTPHLPRCPLTVKELLVLWLSERRQSVKPSSCARYALLAERHIIPELGSLYIRDLTAKKLNAFMEGKLRRGRLDGTGGLSPKTVSDIMIVLKSAMRMVRREYALSAEVLEIKGPARRQKRVEVFGDQEADTLTRAVLSEPDLSGAAYLLCVRNVRATESGVRRVCTASACVRLISRSWSFTVTCSRGLSPHSTLTAVPLARQTEA